jgi:hypothetical protein
MHGYAPRAAAKAADDHHHSLKRLEVSRSALTDR